MIKNPRNCLIVRVEVMREAICRLLLVEPLRDGDLHSDALQGFLFFTGFVLTPNVSPFCSTDLERTAKYTLPAPQKVGRTTENVLFACNHRDILHPCGYETQ